MFVSRTFKNNLGFQIQVDRTHPLSKYNLTRINKNKYSYNGYDTSMSYTRGRERGLQYGGGVGDSRNSIKDVVDILIEKHQNPQSGSGIVLGQTLGSMMNPLHNWRSGLNYFCKPLSIFKV